MPKFTYFSSWGCPQVLTTLRGFSNLSSELCHAIEPRNCCFTSLTMKPSIKKGPYNLLNKIKGEKSPFNKYFFSLTIVEKAHGDIIIHCVVLKVNNTSTVFIIEFRVLNNDENVRY